MSIALQIILIAVGTLIVTAPSWFMLSKIEAFVERLPKKECNPNGKTPLALGTGNGIGVSMLGDFKRRVGYVQYSFFMLGLPIIPLGCYISSVSSSLSKNWKKTETNYVMRGSQPWSFAEILCIYYQYWGRLLFVGAVILLIIGIVELAK